MSNLQRQSYKLLGPIASARFNVDKVRNDLAKARIPVRAEAYVAFALTSALATLVGALLLSAFIGLVLLPQVGVNPAHPTVWMGMLLAPIVPALAVYGILLTSPASKGHTRGKNVDAFLPYALNYIAAMASAGVPVYEIFRSLANQNIYGEMAMEARWVTKDIFLGTDAVTAMRRAADRSPSSRWSEVLQGAITTVTSGGDLKSYFAQKADRYAWENRQVQKQFVEVMGLMAETYVTAAVAGPLFLIVMLAIMSMLGSGDPGILYILVYVGLPLINGGFMVGLMSMSPKV